MAYDIYLTEQDGATTNYVKLDTEGVDFTGLFSLSDIQDISKRSDTFSKQITFKGTKTNMAAFGSFPALNKSTNLSLTNTLGYNYNPLRMVDCLVYENNELLMRGQFTIQRVKVKDGTSYFETSIKGYYISFAEFISDKYLSDLDLSGLKHRLTSTNIRNSWATSIETFNTSTSSYLSKTFQKGSGYVYPYIDYGETFKKASANTPRHNPEFHFKNFRPAIYVKEYFDRIFSQPGLSGYTYEIKGDELLKNQFDSLIIPNNVERMRQKSSDKNFTLTKTTADTNDAPSQKIFENGKKLERPINLQNGLSATTTDNLVNKFGTYRSSNTSAVFNVDQTFVCDGLLSVTFASFANSTGRNMKLTLQLVKRKGLLTNDLNWDNPTSWEIVGSKSVLVPTSLAANTVIDVELGETTYEQGEQIMARMLWEDAEYSFPFYNQITYNITAASLKLPRVTSTGVITYDIPVGAAVTPAAPDNIKQLDFIKSIINLFNFYVYSDRLNPRHLIFETYDDFYALSELSIAKTVALDWTGKVDISKTSTFTSNLSIPKKYLFTFKDDSDYFNKDYKDRANRIYGELNFNDALGFTDSKKLELIFSPTPTVEYSNTFRQHPAIFSGTTAEPKPVKSNIRVLFYNGLKSCTKYNISTDKYVNLAPQLDTLETSIPFYPNCSEYYLADGQTSSLPLYALQFGRPGFTYFGSDSTHESAPNIYFSRFVNQVTQMTNQDMSFVELEIMLNENDIKELDFKVPVFIDMQDLGNGYFKLISVDYKSNIYPSIVTLQKISI